MSTFNPAGALAMPRRSSRAEVAAQTVERRIEDGQLGPGTRLGTRRELAASLAIAPSTVSEAIKLLEDRGRIYTRTGTGGGLFVAQPRPGIRLARTMMSVSGSAAEVAEALAIRDSLEESVVVGAAEAKHSVADLDALRAAMRLLESAQGTTAFYRRNLEFHREVAGLCQNSMLRTIYTSLLEIVRIQDPVLVPLPSQNPGRLHAKRLHVHQAILDAVAAGDQVMARAAVRVHARQGRARQVVVGHAADPGEATPAEVVAL